MDLCARCGQTKRWDESLTHMQFQGSDGLAAGLCCPRCFAETLDLRPPTPRKYPPGCKMPLHPRLHPALGHHIPICGLCRLALWEDDRVISVRLRYEDAIGTPFEGVIVDGDSYSLCRDCRDLFELSVRKRLADMKILDRFPPPQLTALAGVGEDNML